MELELKLNEVELEKLQYNSEFIKNILVSRAIYNESLKFDFTKEQLVALKLNEEARIMKAYLDTLVEPKIMINENQIIEKYNENKAIFEENKVSFKDAREMVLAELKKAKALELQNDVLKEIIENMEEDACISKEELLYTNANAEDIKQIVINNIVMKEIKKTSFLEENAENVELLKQETRMNFFVRIFNSQDIKVLQKEVEDAYNENIKQFENVPQNEAYQHIFNQLFEAKFNSNVQKYIEDIIEKNKILELVESYKTKEVIN